MSNRELLVSKIENGIVIDHIPAGRAFGVLKLLRVDPDARALVAVNIDSKSMGRKDIIKVEGSYLTSREIDVVAFVAPDATLNVVQGWEIKEKRKIRLPRQVEGIFKCPNPLCPTNAPYTPPKTLFNVEEGGRVEETKLHCTFCGSVTYYGTIQQYLNSEGFTLEGRGLVSQEKIERVFLEALIKGGALRFPKSPREPFILKSGRPSPYFINLGALTDGEDLNKLRFSFASYIALLLERGDIPDFDYVFGPSYKGISIAALTCEGLKDLYGIKKRYMYDRKEEKNYGDVSTDRVLVGANYFKPGQRILVVDDTITTGETKMDTIKKLEMLGEHKIVGVVIAVDRQEKMGDRGGTDDLSAAQYLEKDLGIKVFSIENIATIYKLIKDTLDSETKRLWLDYYARYGVVKLE